MPTEGWILIFTKTDLLSSASNGTASEAVELAGAGVTLAIAATTVGGNGAVFAVETSLDGVNWVALGSHSQSLDSYAEYTETPPPMKFVRVNYPSSGATSALSVTLVAFA